MKFLVSVAAIVWLSSALGADLRIVEGPFDLGGYTLLTVAVTNSTSVIADMVQVQCAFLRKGALLSVGDGVAYDIAPWQSTVVEISARNAQGADSADCHVVY